VVFRSFGFFISVESLFIDFSCIMTVLIPPWNIFFLGFWLVLSPIDLYAAFKIVSVNFFTIESILS